MYTGYLVRWRAIYTRAAQLTACERMRTVIICIKVCIRHHSGNFRHMHTKFLVLSLFFSSPPKKRVDNDHEDKQIPHLHHVCCVCTVLSSSSTPLQADIHFDATLYIYLSMTTSCHQVNGHWTFSDVHKLKRVY